MNLLLTQVEGGVRQVRERHEADCGAEPADAGEQEGGRGGGEEERPQGGHQEAQVGNMDIVNGQIANC